MAAPSLSNVDPALAKIVQAFEADRKNEIAAAVTGRQQLLQRRTQPNAVLTQTLQRLGTDAATVAKAQADANAQSQALLQKLKAGYQAPTLDAGSQAPNGGAGPRQGGMVVKPFYTSQLSTEDMPMDQVLTNGTCWQADALTQNGGGLYYFDTYWYFYFTPPSTGLYLLLPYINLAGECWMHSQHDWWEFWSNDFATAMIQVWTNVYTGAWRGFQTETIYQKSGQNIDVVDTIRQSLNTSRTEGLAGNAQVVMGVWVRLLVDSGGSAYSELIFGSGKNYPICCPQLIVSPE